jgi:SOS-response transcriptional repressor LexA
MARVGGNTARLEIPGNFDNMNKKTTFLKGNVDVGALCVQGDAMAPLYCEGDIVLYRRPGKDLAVKPGNDVLALLPGPEGELHLVLRRLVRWDGKVLELRPLNTHYPCICRPSRDAVLCGKAIGCLRRPAVD